MAILLSCGTGPANISENFSLFETDSERARPSEEKIDQGKTYEIYFRLNRPEPCIHVTMTASYLPYRFAKQEKASTVYFVVERLIDISSFRKNEKSVYSLIGRNFDNEWAKNKEIKICDSVKDPLLKVDKSSLYRLRFTAFRPESTGFRIKIYGDVRVNYFYTETEARNYRSDIK